MNRRRWIAVPAGLFATAALAGCAYPKAAEPPERFTEAEVESLKPRFPDSTEVSFSAGRKLFVNKCGSCHDYSDVMVIDDSRWPGIMKSMGKDAKLTEEQSGKVLQWILAVRAARRDAPVSK
ncbi:MAG: hypothetical protein K8T20_07655 [Planctomycetes bacterium]|nr:hypothetical protein [Planctomycetota bacterium]